MVEVIESNVLRIGRKIAVVVVLAATIHVLLAPYFYVKGILVWGNSMTDFWAFTYTFTHLSETVLLDVEPLLLFIGIYEVARGIFFLAKGLVVTIKRVLA